MEYFKKRKEQKERNKAKELILTTVHEKLFSIQEDCKEIAKAYDRNTLPLKTLKNIIDMNRVKPEDMEELKVIDREIPEAYNGILDSVYTLSKEIAKQFGGKVSIMHIDSAVNVNWYNFEERIELTYSKPFEKE